MNAAVSHPPARPYNRTRRSSSLPLKFLRTGALHWLLLYPLLRLSDLVREGMDHSGSYRFADHLYRAEPSGRGPLGRWLDARMLRMPASRAFRQRYLEATRTLVEALDARPGHGLRVLAVPCGLPRDLREAAARRPAAAARIDYHGLDIDPELIRLALAFTDGAGVGSRAFHAGDALDPAAYPRRDFDVTVSTGLGEFLDDEQLARLYANIHDALAPGGVFFTSATRREPRSERLLRAFELHSRYRAEPELRRLLAPLGWARLEFTVDTTGLQTFVRAWK